MNMNQTTTIINLLQEKGFMFSKHSTAKNLEFYRRTNEGEADEISINTEGLDEVNFLIVHGKSNRELFRYRVQTFDKFKDVIQSIS
jgi:hypothetical protein